MTDGERAEVLEKLLANTVAADNGCRIWMGCTQGNGYGRATVRLLSDGVHRHVYRCVHGEIPDGMDVCHKCDVRNCIAPSHLFAGTRLHNMQDAVRKGRQARGGMLPQTKLSDEARAAIVAMAKAGESYHDIAAKFDICSQRAGQIAIKAGLRRNTCVA